MRIPEARPPGPRLTRYARWLGLDRNPLRRRTDRIEAAMRLATVILFLVAVPLVCIAVGQLAAHLAQRQAHAQAAAERQVTAVLLQTVRPDHVPDPYSSVQISMPAARWAAPRPAVSVRAGPGPGRRPRGKHRDDLGRRCRAVTSPPDTGVVDAAVAVAVEISAWPRA